MVRYVIPHVNYPVSKVTFARIIVESNLERLGSWNFQALKQRYVQLGYFSHVIGAFSSDDMATLGLVNGHVPLVWCGSRMRDCSLRNTTEGV